MDTNLRFLITADSSSGTATIQKFTSDLENMGAKAASSSGQARTASDAFSGSLTHLGEVITGLIERPIQTLQVEVTSLLEHMGPTAVAIGGVAVALAAAGVAMFEFTKSVGEEAEHLRNMATQTGETAQTLQALGQFAHEAGLDNLDLARTIGMLNAQLSKGEDGTGSFAKALSSFGITTKDSNGHVKSAVGLLDELRVELLSIQDPTERAQAAQGALGGRLRELIPLLLNSDISLAAAVKEMEKAGIVWDDSAQNKLKHLDEAYDRFGRTTAAIWTQIKGDVAGAADTSITTLDRWTKGITHFFEFTHAVSTSNQWLPDYADLWKKTGEEVPKDVEKTTQSLYSLMQASDKLALTNAVNSENWANQRAALIAVKSAFDDLRLPLKKIHDDYGELMSAGASTNDFLRLHYAEIVKAHDAQLALGQAISQSSEKLYNEALRIKETKDVWDAFTIRAKAEETVELVRQMADMFTYLGSQAQVVAPVVERSVESILHSAENQLNLMKGVQIEWINTVADGADDFTRINDKMIEDANKGFYSGNLVAESQMQQWIKIHEDAANSSNSIWKKAMGNIASDVSKSFTDILFAGKSFADTFLNLFIEMGKAIVRGLILQLFLPFQKQLLGLLTGAGRGGGILGGILGGASGGGGSIGDYGGEVGGGLGGAGAAGGLTGSAASIAAMIGPALSGYFSGVGVSKLAGGGVGGGVAGASAGLLTAELASNIAASMAAGTGIGAGISGFAGAMMANPITAGIAIGAIVIPLLVKAFGGKDSWTAGAMEVARDLGGIQLGKDVVQKFAEGVGLTESSAYGVRKDLLSSPLFLTQVAYPIAVAQGKVAEFLNSISQVQTVGGTIDLAKPFKDFLATGSVDALNKAWNDMFKNSSALLAVMPDFASKLFAVGKAAEATAAATDNAARSAIQASNSFNLLNNQKSSAGFPGIGPTGNSLSGAIPRTGSDTVSSTIAVKTGLFNENTEQWPVNYFKITDDQIRQALNVARQYSDFSLIGGFLNQSEQDLGLGIMTQRQVDVLNSAMSLSAGGLFPSRIPSFAGGGIMPYTGIAQLHAGERVTPAGQSDSITINIENVYGIDDLDRKISESVARTVRRGGLRILSTANA